MKQLALLLTLPLVLAACGADDTDRPAEITTPDAAEIIETAPAETAAVFPAPVVTSPAAGAMSSRTPTVISGTVDPAAVKVTVNGWELSRFVPHSGAFTYLAAPDFANVVIGDNSYEIVATSADGTEAKTTFSFIYQPAQ